MNSDSIWCFNWLSENEKSCSVDIDDELDFVLAEATYQYTLDNGVDDPQACCLGS